MTTTPATPSGPGPATLTARSPEDVLAVVPVVLGFVPDDSVVMLTFGAARPFHARVDLPPPEGLPELVEVLLDPARRHEVRRVVFVVYTDDDRAAREAVRLLRPAFRRAGIDVVDALRADGRRWFPIPPGRPGVPVRGVPYDVTAHPFLARSVFEGQVTHASREDLAATLAPDVDAAAEVAAALERLAGAAPGRVLPTLETGWVCDLVRRHVAAGTDPTPVETARLLRALREVRVRDAAWSLMDRGSAHAQVRFWTGVVRAAPVPVLAAPAALLGFAAWLAGHGALAWCALDRCAEADPDYRLASYLAQALTAALPPSAWDPGSAGPAR